MCFSGTNQKPERRRPFRTGLVRHCPQGLFSPFFTFLRALFSRPFRLSLAPTICPWVSEDGYSFVDDIRLYFRLYLGPPQEEKERGLIYRTGASNRAEICFCMYSTAFASISSTALEIEALSFAVNRFRKKTKGHSEPKWGVTPGEILFRIETHVFASEEYECK